ncbi:hypothetical protein VTH06DRAFT_7676 [Thermothelomyces fergusii]
MAVNESEGRMSQPGKWAPIQLRRTKQLAGDMRGSSRFLLKQPVHGETWELPSTHPLLDKPRLVSQWSAATPNQYYSPAQDETREDGLGGTELRLAITPHPTTDQHGAQQAGWGGDDSAGRAPPTGFDHHGFAEEHTCAQRLALSQERTSQPAR